MSASAPYVKLAGDDDPAPMTVYGGHCCSALWRSIQNRFAMLLKASEDPLMPDGVTLKTSYKVCSAINNMIALGIYIFPIEVDRRFLHHGIRAITSRADLPYWGFVVATITTGFSLYGAYRQYQQNKLWQKYLDDGALVQRPHALEDALTYRRYEHPAPNLAERLRIISRITMVNFAVDLSNFFVKAVNVTGALEYVAFIGGVLAVGFPLWYLRTVNEVHVARVRSMAKDGYYSNINWLLGRYHNRSALEAPLLADPGLPPEALPVPTPIKKSSSKLDLLRSHGIAISREVSQTAAHAFQGKNCGLMFFSMLSCFALGGLYAVMAIFPTTPFDYDDDHGYRNLSFDLSNIPRIVGGALFVLGATFGGGVMLFQKLDRYFYNHRETKRIKRYHFGLATAFDYYRDTHCCRPEHYHPDQLKVVLEQDLERQRHADEDARSSGFSLSGRSSSPFSSFSPTGRRSPSFRSYSPSSRGPSPVQPVILEGDTDEIDAGYFPLSG